MLFIGCYSYSHCIFYSCFVGTNFTCRIPKRMPPPMTVGSHPNFRLHQNRPPLQELDQGVLTAQSSAFAEGTLSNLTTQWVNYLSFCLEYGFEPLPASVSTLCRYAKYLALNLKSHESLLNYVSGVKTLHVLIQLPVDSFSDSVFQLTVKGLRRLNSHVPHEAPPMTPQALLDIYNLLDLSKEDDVILWAILLIGFFLLLRKCNLVPDSTAKYDSTKQLSRGNIEILDEYVRVTLTWTKNHQFGNKPLRFALPFISGSPLCPATALINVLELVEGNPDESVFKKSDGSCFTYRMLQSRLAQLSRLLGIPQEDKFTSHSLRAGGATHAFLSGVPAEIIKILGHWKSDCYLRYIRMPEQARFAAGLLMKKRILSLDL